jgi:RimJ/RimL family protein N-acetyltransferase
MKFGVNYVFLSSMGIGHQAPRVYNFSHLLRLSMILFETPRLLIRQLNPGDIDPMFTIFGNPVVTKWMGDGTALSRELCEKWIDVSLRNYETKGFGASAIVEKESGVFIGCAGIVYDAERQEPEIIYAFHPDYWGKGYASELVPHMLRYGFDQCHLPYILATIDSENKTSQKIIERAGMKLISTEVEPDGQNTLLYRIDSNP